MPSQERAIDTRTTTLTTALLATGPWGSVAADGSETHRRSLLEPEARFRVPVGEPLGKGHGTRALRSHIQAPVEGGERELAHAIRLLPEQGHQRGVWTRQAED